MHTKQHGTGNHQAIQLFKGIVDIHPRKGKNEHGELLLNITGFMCVALLGFLPLLIVQFADRTPSLRFNGIMRPRRLDAGRISIVVLLTNWLRQFVP